MVKHAAGSLDVIFAALADPIRRGIVERLARGEVSVGDLAAPFRVSAPAISRHLRVLERAGLLTRRKEGRVHRCRLRPRPMTDAAQWIEECRKFWEGQFDRLALYLQESMPAEPAEKENITWPQPAPAPRRRSKSQGSSPRRGKGSSGRGRNPNR